MMLSPAAASFTDAVAVADPRSFFYKVFAMNACGVVSPD